MAITPNDIINKEFRKTLRGYDADQVDEYLQAVSDTLVHYLEENQRLKAHEDELRTRVQHYQETEALLSNALILAERTADETRQQAHQEADLIRREAEHKITAERTTLEEMRQYRLRIVTELRSLLRSHLTLLDSQEERLAPLPALDEEKGD
jgi:cell division initiation protein